MTTMKGKEEVEKLAEELELLWRRNAFQIPDKWDGLAKIILSRESALRRRVEELSKALKIIRENLRPKVEIHGFTSSEKDIFELADEALARLGEEGA